MSLQSGLIKMIKDTIGDTPRKGVEIGVYKGVTSKALLKAFPGCHMILVDPWQEWAPEDSYYKHKRTGKHDQAKWNAVYNKAMENIKHPNKRARVLRTTSAEAAHDPSLVGESFDFVFIDGNHMYDAVKQDIELWYPKTRKLICGDDYGGKYRGVKLAVDERFGAESLIIDTANRLWGYVVEDFDCGCH